MTHEDFIAFLAEAQEHQREVLASKNKEYAPNSDKMANFKKAGRAAGKPAEEMLWAFAMKHFISIQDIVYGDTEYTPEIMREKCGDFRNYLILLEALLSEKL